MPNASVPAAAEGLPSVRSLDDLLDDFLNNQRVQNECRFSVAAIEAHLPDWVKPGPMYLYHDGRIDGPVVGWPQVARLPAPPENPAAFRKIRKGVRDTWQDVCHPAFCPPKSDTRPMSVQMRRKARLRGFAAVREVIARVRERDAILEASGINAFYGRWDDLSNTSIRLQDEMLDRFCNGVGAEALALTLVLEIVMDCNVMEPIGEQGGRTGLAIEMLPRFAPHLSGLLRIVVDDLIAGKHLTNYELMVGRGWPLDGCYSPGDEGDTHALQMGEAA